MASIMQSTPVNAAPNKRYANLQSQEVHTNASCKLPSFSVLLDTSQHFAKAVPADRKKKAINDT